MSGQVNAWLRKVAAGVSYRCLRPVNAGLHYLECALSDSSDTPLCHAPIFIIGAPRSGSTLLYQLLLHRFGFAYLSNLHDRFYGGPSFVEMCFPISRRPTGQSYESYHGTVNGWFGPSECGSYWYRFFRRSPQYVSLHEADHRKLKDLRGAVRRLQQVAGRSVLFKNLLCSVRLEPIMAALPEALFLIMERSLVDNAHSILEGRKHRFGSYEVWWSVEPPGHAANFELPGYEQVVRQIDGIQQLIEQSIETHGESRFLKVNYDQMCTDTSATIANIEEFLARHKVALPARNDVPSSFQQRNEIRIDRDTYRHLVEHVRRVA